MSMLMLLTYFLLRPAPPPDSHISKLSQPRSEQRSESNNYIQTLIIQTNNINGP